jgi:hypothetical protein
MARIRSIKPEFFTSLTIGSLSERARLAFIGIWTFVDDYGRAVDDARLVKAAVFPLDDRARRRWTAGPLRGWWEALFRRRQLERAPEDRPPHFVEAASTAGRAFDE